MSKASEDDTSIQAVQEAWRCLNEGNYEAALRELEVAQSLAPGNADVYLIKGIALGRLGRHKDALEAFDISTQLDPHNSYGWVNRGVALSSLGRYEEALRDFDRAIEISPRDLLACGVAKPQLLYP